MLAAVVAVSACVALLTVLSSTGGASGRRARAGCPPPRTSCSYRYDIAWTLGYHTKSQSEVKTDIAVTFRNILVNVNRNTDTSTGKPVQAIEIHGFQQGGGLSPLTAKVVFDAPATGTRPACRWEKVYRRRAMLMLDAGVAIDYKKGKKPTGVFDIAIEELPAFAPDLSSICDALDGLTLDLLVQGSTPCNVLRGSGETCKVTGTKGFQGSGAALSFQGSIEIVPRQSFDRLSFPIGQLWYGKNFVIRADATYVPPVRTSFSKTNVRIVFTRRR